jgi:L-malate glycosyltransferase
MRICLLSTTYPPTNTEGIARQRQVLATELCRRGHDIHIVTPGSITHTRRDGSVQVHEVAISGINHYSNAHPELDIPLSASQALYERLVALHAEHAWDIVDVPLWAAQGFVTIHRYAGPTVLWLQTSSAQLRAINGQAGLDEGAAIMGLERACLERADGLLGDSQVALETTLHDYQIHPRVPTAIAHLGLAELQAPTAERSQRPTVEALVVGRLERRKGTPLLFDLLPDVLRQNPHLVVRFVGRDNSANDGWGSRHNTTYPEFFQHRYPALAQRVIFEGYVDDQRLSEYYRQADFLLAPSLYESFGLVYLEAMRARLPVIAFAAGGACEIFPADQANGALLVPVADQRQLAAAITRMAQRPELRRQLGEHGLKRFQQAFSAERMADATLDCYAHVIADHHARRQVSDPIYQVMEALDIGDAVSNIARHHAGLLAELGQPAAILSRQAHESLKHETRPLATALSHSRSGLIFHYWGYNTSTWLAQSLRGRKAIYYHNITPPEFFSPGSEMFGWATDGYAQLQRIANIFDLIVGDSRYNLAEFARFLHTPRPMLHLYPVVEAAEIRSAAYDRALLAHLRQSSDVNMLFVGRVARNKRQDQVMLAFDHYWREHNRSARLWLVGNDQGDPIYRAEIEQLRTSLASGKQIVLTGKISDLELQAYYRAADIFMCASMHEGFCIPIAHAMAFDVPVLAYAAAAVPETMGGEGILIHDWQVANVATTLDQITSDATFRERLLIDQRASLSRFSLAEARQRLAAIVLFLQNGTPSALFEE